jgi:putative addiction module killer protein
MIEIRQSATFMAWFRGLRDRRAQERIAQRLVRLGAGLVGDSRPVGAGVMELRVDYGPGYRLYFVWRGETLILLLSGGDKGSQRRDITKAKAMAAELEE